MDVLAFARTGVRDSYPARSPDGRLIVLRGYRMSAEPGMGNLFIVQSCWAMLDQ